MRGNKFEKSHIHIMKSETLSRESRVTESTKEIVNFIPYNCVRYTYFYQLSTLVYSLWKGKKKGEDDEYMFHLVYYWWFRGTQYITSICLFYKNMGIYLECCLTM